MANNGTRPQKKSDPSEPRWACPRNPNHSNPAPATHCGIPGCGAPRR